MEEKYFECKKERDAAKNSDTVKYSEEHMKMIISLDGSRNFETTHTIMPKLLAVDNWSEEEIDMLLEIALNRHPVRYLLNDDDVNAFYRKIIGMLKKPTEKAKKVMKRFDKE